MTPDSLDRRPVRWGIVGTGGIATAFVLDLELLPDAEVVAVGSRSQTSADAFGDAHDIGHRYSTYAELVADPEVDVVYVATPHPGHYAAALLAIEAGKAVLVEKPFMLNAREAEEVVAAARQQGTFLMEAMWTRFLPHVVEVRALLAAGAIGDVVSVVADHGQWFPEDASHRLFAPELGGGALLDLGVYPISFCSMVLGTPSRVTAAGTKAFTGVDAQTSLLLEHASGAHGVVTTTLAAATANTAVINGTAGRIEIARTFYAPSSYTVYDRVGQPELHTVPFAGHGLRMQATEVGRCLRAGLTESPIMPLDETLAIMRTMDEARRQTGLAYPGE
ncbi:MAG TPA: Gfo/Idh/MocA family oxidoreductase [Candidatus Limnocylindria bacterium]|nr:Gfo/Idh/MocA family oxidoreductase [Candidatus Limnocylindria bacterium]